MLETYKILGSSLVFDSFTIKELSDYSQAKENTVRTVISRHSSYFIKGGRNITKKKGGQPTVFKINPSMLNELRKKVGNVFEQLKPNIGVTPDSKHTPSLPLSLLVAKNILDKIIPLEKNKSDLKYLDKIPDLINLAKMNLNNAEYEYNNSLQDKTDMLDNEVQAYIKTIKGLLRFLEAENVYITEKAKPQDFNIIEVYLNLANSTQEMWDSGKHNQEFAFNIMQRTAHSPLIKQALTF